MKIITAELLTIGDELLYGQILDTNSQWMSVAMSEAGFKVIRKTTVGDIEDEIIHAFAEAESRADIVLITGGLGPTNDDLTKPCLCKHFVCGLKIHEEALEEVTAFFKSRGRELTEINRQQAALPECCEKITNAVGTAPGMWFERNNKVFVSMPGVPHEMKLMMTNIILPKLKNYFATPTIVHQVIRTIGLGESFLAEKIASWENALPDHIKLAYLPGLGEVRLRLTGIGPSATQLHDEIKNLTGQLQHLISEYIYGYGEEPIEAAVGKILKLKQMSISLAESCTGGYLSHLMTSVPGSSAYFKGSVIAYANEIKMQQLEVNSKTLELFGAVSEETISEMAIGVRRRFNTDIGIATSGIAGPDGGTPDKPVGTVWIAYSDGNTTVTKKLQLSRDRILNIRYASMAALNLLRISMNERS